MNRNLTFKVSVDTSELDAALARVARFERALARPEADSTPLVLAAGAVAVASRLPRMSRRRLLGLGWLQGSR